MNVYKYNEQTKEYIRTEQAQLDPLETKKQQKNIYLLPANATFTEPPEVQEGYVNVWNGEAWEQVEDNRGVEYWMPEDKYGAPAHEMKELGALPEGATLTPPKQTQEEKDNIEALAVKNELKDMAVNAMMMSLADDNLVETKKAYQTKLRSISDGAALKMPEVFPHWSSNSKDYVLDDKVLYNGVLYKVITAHTSQESWTPEAAPSLFIKVLTSKNEILDWEQPSADNAYMKGDKVKYNGKIYESLIDNNVWSPDGYPAGWKEITETITIL